MNQALKWLLPIVAFLVIAGLAQAQFRKAEGVAIAEGARADMMAERVTADSLALIVATDALSAQDDSIAILTKAVEAAASRARSERRRAGALADTLRGRVEATAGDSAAVVALVDSILVAKDDEIHAIEVQLSVALTQIPALFRAIDTRDLLLDQHVKAAELLHMEIAALRTTVAAVWRVARPGFFLRIKQDAGLVAGTAVVTVVAVALLRR